MLGLEPNRFSAHDGMISAEPVIARLRTILAAGQFTEVVVWRLPHPVPPSIHLFKYRLVYIEDGVRVVGFDNERGKGDHMHVGGTETAYTFTGIDTLIDDFAAAVERWRRYHGAG